MTPAAPALPPPGPAQPCSGCTDFTLDLPAEPSEEDFGTQDNTTVEVLVTFPSGWSQLTCADQYNVVARRELPTDVPVPGWRCLMPNLNQMRFVGPGAATFDESAQRFTFRGRSPSQIVDTSAPFTGALTAGFVDVVQTFRDGEQQKRRGLKQLQARRDVATKRGFPTALTPLEIALNTVWVDLPPDWVGECATLDNTSDGTPKVGGITRIRAGNWECGPIPGTGANPRYRVQWEPESDGDAARYFDFNAYTKLDQPTLLPFSATDLPGGIDRIRDLSFVDGVIRTARIAYLKKGTATPTPTPTVTAAATAAATSTPRPTPSYQPLCPTSTPGFNTTAPQTTTTGTLQNPYPLGYAQPGAPGYPEGPFVYPYNPVQPPAQVPFPGYPYAVGPGIDGLAHDPCAPPTVVLDPCSGELFTKNGTRRFLPEDRDLPDGCALPFDRREGAVGYYRGERCLINKPDPGTGHRPPNDPRAYGPAPEGPGGRDHAPHRADRSYARPPLPAVPGPTAPPVVAVPPGADDTVARVPGAPDERLLLATPNASPAPVVEALLPDEPLPFCEDLALPHAGADSVNLLKLGLGTVGVGAALLAGAIYWRRHAPRGLRYGR